MSPTPPPPSYPRVEQPGAQGARSLPAANVRRNGYIEAHQGPRLAVPGHRGAKVPEERSDGLRVVFRSANSETQQKNNSNHGRRTQTPENKEIVFLLGTKQD